MSFEVQKRLKIAILITGSICLLEIIGGWISHSLALLSDAAHMFSDMFALSLSAFALYISSRPSTSTKTYGYHRVEIFASFCNGLLIVVMGLFILLEAYDRIHTPREVDALIVSIVAALGLATNLWILYILKPPMAHSHDLNLKSAFYHVIGDSLASVGVIVSGIVIYFTQWYAIDSIISIGIAGLLFWGAKTILSESLHILLEGVPKGISLKEVEDELTSIPDIKGIHELHIWCICSNIYALSTHALVNDQKVNQMNSVLDEANSLLKEKFNITHSTIQFESNPCDQATALCDIKH